VYWAYFKAGSGLLAIAILIVLSAAEAMNQWQQVHTRAVFMPFFWQIFSTVTRKGMQATRLDLKCIPIEVPPLIAFKGG
jgi:ascorbate-specific PTS system EIIC-type component UlaA